MAEIEAAAIATTATIKTIMLPKDTQVLERWFALCNRYHKRIVRMETIITDKPIKTTHGLHGKQLRFKPPRDKVAAYIFHYCDDAVNYEPEQKYPVWAKKRTPKIKFNKAGLLDISRRGVSWHRLEKDKNIK